MVSRRVIAQVQVISMESVYAIVNDLLCQQGRVIIRAVGP